MNKKLKCILLIDDSEFDNFLHKMIIEKAEIAEDVKIAHNGKEALEIVESDSKNGSLAELILLDINMPGMGGFEFMQKYDSHLKHLKTAIYMLTTSTYQADINNAKKFENVKGFLNKPLTVEALRDVYEENFTNNN